MEELTVIGAKVSGPLLGWLSLHPSKMVHPSSNKDDLALQQSSKLAYNVSAELLVSLAHASILVSKYHCWSSHEDGWGVACWATGGPVGDCWSGVYQRIEREDKGRISCEYVTTRITLWGWGKRVIISSSSYSPCLDRGRRLDRGGGEEAAPTLIMH
jgi:hypothetical protein